jgi:hypothetical protein
MNTTINIYVESNGPRNIGTDEVLIYGSPLGGPRTDRIFEFNVSRRSLARALAIDAAPFYGLTATAPASSNLQDLRNTIADLECQIERGDGDGTVADGDEDGPGETIRV